MEQIYNKKMNELGYGQFVCDIFLNWEDVKDEILLPDRKEGSGNGTVHVFLGAADECLKKEFPGYYKAVTNGEDPSVGAIKITHYFVKSNVLSMLGYVCEYYKKKDVYFLDTVINVLTDIDNAKQEDGLLSTSSLLKLSIGSNKLRPYFKQFDSKGIFHQVIRQLLLPNSAYKIALYKNANDEYAAFWLIGFGDLDDFMADANKDKIEKPLNELKNCEKSFQQIFYGAPGTGKSHAINELTAGKDVIRTTFHPDTDYSTFVGAYKPTTKSVPVTTVIGTNAVPVMYNGKGMMEDKIVYEYVSQAFLQAYVAAWRKYCDVQEGEEPMDEFLVIEEINRGNCAQIFGDLFQLLENMRQRGAEGADNKTGDGAGLMLQIPHEFILLQGIPVPEKGKYGTGLIFLPKDEKKQQDILSIMIEEIEREGLQLMHLRNVPTNPDCLGEAALSNEPAIKQVFITGVTDDKVPVFERTLYLIRKRIEKRISDPDFYICSFYIGYL